MMRSARHTANDAVDSPAHDAVNSAHSTPPRPLCPAFHRMSAGRCRYPGNGCRGGTLGGVRATAAEPRAGHRRCGVPAAGWHRTRPAVRAAGQAASYGQPSSEGWGQAAPSSTNSALRIGGRPPPPFWRNQAVRASGQPPLPAPTQQ
eukprot:364598-Chlamydomonas_euryale.AAC.4